MVCCDSIVVLKLKDQPVKILLIRRKNDPYKNSWALPGGFIEMEEDLEKTAIRELEEEAGIRLEHMTQFATYGSPDRDPRGRNISVVYYHVSETEITVRAGDDATDADWFDVSNLPPLAFDHEDVIRDFLRLNK